MTHRLFPEIWMRYTMDTRSLTGTIEAFATMFNELVMVVVCFYFFPIRADRPEGRVQRPFVSTFVWHR